MKEGIIYLLKSTRTGRLYLGSTTDLEKRLATHNSGSVKATKNKGPWVVFCFWEFESAAEARSIETKIKRYKRALSEELVEYYIQKWTS